MSASHLGSHRSPESIAKTAAAHRGRKATPEQRERLSEAHKGQVAWNRGATANAESRAAYSAGQRRRFERPEEREAARNAHSRWRRTGDCAYCGEAANSWDHVIPRGRPGWDAPENKVPACITCNNSKGPRTPGEWQASLAAYIARTEPLLALAKARLARLER